jgi:two-component system chemotaxis response regulator CheB
MTGKLVGGGELICDGPVCLVVGELHARLMKRGTESQCVFDAAPPVNHQKQSVDVLFHSLAELAPLQTVAALLTGMGAGRA